jgi:hypothetical protein
MNLMEKQFKQLNSNSQLHTKELELDERIIVDMALTYKVRRCLQILFSGDWSKKACIWGKKHLFFALLGAWKTLSYIMLWAKSMLTGFTSRI